MDYFLRQIGPRNFSPLIIELRSDDVVVGSDIYPDLAKYPHVLPQHAQFKRESGKWFVKSMQMSEKIYVNNSPLVTHRFREIVRGDQISFGVADKQTCFRCFLSAREKEVIDLSSDEPYDPEILVVYNKKVKECVEKNKHTTKRPVVGANESEYIGSPTLESNRSCHPSSHESNGPTPVPTNSDFVYKTIKREQVNDSGHSVNREQKGMTPSAIKNELNDGCSLTVLKDYGPFTENESLNNNNLPIPPKKNEPVNNRSFIINCGPMDTYQPTIKSEPVDTTNPFTIAHLVNTVPPTSNEPVPNTFPSVKSEPLDSSLNLSHSLSLPTLQSDTVSANQFVTSSTKERNSSSDSEHFVNSVSVNKGVSAVEGSFDDFCPPTVKSEPVDDVRHSTENDLMDITLSGIKSEMDYSCPPTVRNDYVPFINDEPPDINPPARVDESSNKHYKTKSKSLKNNPSIAISQPTSASDPFTNAKLVNEYPLSTENDLMDISLSGIKNEIDYSCPPTVRNDYVPFINDEPPDINPPARVDETSNKQHYKTKSKSSKNNPSIAISQPMSASEPFTNAKPVNEYPPLPNMLLSNTFPAVKSEPVDSPNENSTLTSNFVLGTSQSDSVFENQFAASSSKEQIITTKKIQPALSSSSAVYNQGFHENLVSRLENFMSSSKDLPSTIHGQNTSDSATPVKSKNQSINSGYSETEDVITISDDESYLDYGSCNSIQQESLDDYNTKYNENFDISIAEFYNVNELHPLSFENNSILSSINESIKEHEESAKKLLDVGSSSKISLEYSSLTGNISLPGDSHLPHLLFESDSLVSGTNELITEREESGKKMLDDSCSLKNIPEYSSPTENIISVHNSGMERRSSCSSVSSHDEVLYPSIFKKKSDTFSGDKSSEKSNERAAHFAEKENQSTVRTKKTSSTNKKQPVKRTLPTEPKSSCSSRKFRKIEEHKSNSKERSVKKSKSTPEILGRKVLAKNRKYLSVQKAIATTFADKSEASQKLLCSSNKKQQPSKRSNENNIQEFSKISKGAVVTGNLHYKIPKVTKKSLLDVNIAPSSSGNISLKTSQQAKPSVLDKKTPSIARKPNKCLSRSELFLKELTAEKKNPVKNVAEVSKKSVEANKSINSVKMNSSAGREIDKTRLKSGAEQNTLNFASSVSGSNTSSFTGREIDKTRHKSGSEKNSSNVASSVSGSNTSSFTGRETNKIEKRTGSEKNSNIINGIKSSPIPVIMTHPNITNTKNAPIPVIVSSKRSKNRKNLNEDRTLSETTPKINKPLPQTSPRLMDKQFYVDQDEKNFTEYSPTFDKSKTPVISQNDFQSQEQSVPKQFSTHVANTSAKNTVNIELQQSYNDQRFNFNTNSAHTCEKTVTSDSNFQTKHMPLDVTNTSNNARNDLQRHSLSRTPSNNSSALFDVNCTHETTKIFKKVSGRKDFIIKTIIEWKENWFQQYEQVLKPHDELTEGVLHLPLYFNSFDHYISSFIPLLLIEIWEKLSIEYKPIWKNEKRVTNKFYFIVTANEMKGNVFEYKCEALINSLSFEPKVGNLVSLLIQGKHLREAHPILGYINSCEIMNNINDVNLELLNVDRSWIKDASLYRFSVLVKMRNLSPIFNKIMKGNGICSLLNYLKLLEACENLEYSPFCPSFIKPETTTFFSRYPDVPATSAFSKAQMSIIHGISSEILKQVSEHKLFLVQGAPGTGKTQVILGLLQKLIFNCHSKQKILVVAPSSVAIDEIGSRLIKYTEQSRTLHSRERLRFVRVDLEGKISEKMKQFTLEGMCMEYKIESKKEKLKNLNIQIEALLESYDPSHQEEFKYLRKKQVELRDQIESMQSDEKTRLDYYYYLLQESQVILTTVNCCSNSLLQNFCKRNSNLIFSCCIIDEVTQCTELELLQVVSLGINKLILVGDSYGLPAVVLSKTAKNLGYARSAFERFLCCFSQYKQESPAFELLEQYRMHSDICYFPSYCFYNSQLTTADGIDSRHEHFLAVSSEKILAPYTVFYILNRGNPAFYAYSVFRLCIQLVAFKPANSIGIIVPNRKLRDVFNHWIEALQKNKSAIDNKYEVIEVNTVENFQGQEKDTVFLCCYDEGDSQSFLSNRQKLNVALTRARQSLVVCIFLPKRRELDLVNLINDAQMRHCCYCITKAKKLSLILRSSF